MTNKIAPRLDVATLIEAIKRRCSWGDMRTSLQKAELPVGHGWVELEGRATTNSDDAKKIHDHLEAFYKKYLLAGERYTQLYELLSAEAKNLAAAAKKFVVPTSSYTATYPLPTPSLSQLSSELTLAAIEILSNDDVILVFCSPRSYAERLTYASNQIDPRVKQVYSGIDELITIKNIYFQAFDLLILRPSLDRAEICIDLPNLDHIDFEKHALKILGAAASHIPALKTIYESSPLNVFNTIKDIFENPKEGKVSSLSFRTLTGSRKFEKMVRSGDDLRSEAFHNAGMTAVKHEISPYEVTVEWKFAIPPGQASIDLKASIKELSYDEPHLFGFYARAIDDVSFLEAVNKVVKYLN